MYKLDGINTHVTGVLEAAIKRMHSQQSLVLLHAMEGVNTPSPNDRRLS